MAICYSCRNEISDSNFGRHDSCIRCGRDTRVCKNCEFFDTFAHNQCHENQADRVVEKEKANFCDFFRPVTGMRTSESNAGPVDDPRAKAKAAADALFKKKV